VNCDSARELLAGYVLEALDRDEREAVAGHLEHCRDCRALADGLSEAAHQLPSLLLTPGAPELPRSIFGRVRQETAGRTRLDGRRQGAWRQTWRLRVAAAAIVALAVFAVLAAVRSQQAVADAHDLRARLVALVGQQSTIFDVVDSPHTTKALLLPSRAGSTAYGKIYTRSDTHQAVAFVNRLPEEPAGDRYLLWIRSGQAIVRAGVFSLHGGFGYLILHYGGRIPVTDAFLTLQEPSSTPAGAPALELAHD
jgi:hypothetical protein